MNADMLFVFVVLFVTIAVFIWDKFRMDLVALTMMITLLLAGIITPDEAVSGFGDKVVIMIAGLFVIGRALTLTGITAQIGSYLLKVSNGGFWKLMIFLLPLASILAAFLGPTGTVALLIPVVMSMTRRSGESPSRILMPMAFAALIGGMLTLIGTPPNLIVSNALEKAGMKPFSFFDFTPIGGTILLFAIVYLLFCAKWGLKAQTGKSAHKRKRQTLQQLAKEYNVEQKLYKFHVPNHSELVGKIVAHAGLRRNFEATLFGIERRNRLVSSFVPVMLKTPIRPQDILWIYMDKERLSDFVKHYQVERMSTHDREVRRMQQMFGFAEVMIAPESSLIGKTLIEANFRERYGLNIIGLKRGKELVSIAYQETTLKAGDMVLFSGDWEHIRELGDYTHDLLVLNTPVELEEAPSHLSRAPFALLILLFMLIAMAQSWLPNVSIVLTAALLMIITGCIHLREVYRALNPTSLVLIAAMLPMAIAMEKTGALQYIVDHMMKAFDGCSPTVLAVAFFLLTSLLSQFISNTATTVLVAPVAIQVASMMGYSPKPFMMIVAIAASTAFCTPISSPVNALILVPGGYRFADFLKVGLGLQMLAMAIAVVLIPYFFPFTTP